MFSNLANPSPYRESVISLSPRGIDILKLLALMAMLLDHFNTLFLKTPEPLLYGIGRMAFPLFTLLWTMQVLRNTRQLQARARRLWLWAFVTQPFFTLAFRGHDPWYALNILFVFACVTQMLAWSCRYGARGTVGGNVLMAVMLPLLVPASYGLAGLVLAVSMAVWLSPEYDRYQNISGVMTLIALFALNGISHLAVRPADALIMAILPTVILPVFALSLIASAAPAGGRFMPRRFFYFAYTGHLALYGALIAVL